MKVELQIPINRVEGDLDIHLTIENGVVVDAKSVGTLYRGFENFLKGRDPLDALVITPRVCGICSVSHLLASVKALENAYEITPPIQAIRFRNLSNMAENLQSDLRQVFLMFMVDFANEYYKDYSFFNEAKRLYAPFKGVVSKEILNITKDILKIIAHIGGQWPHTSYMVPGGLNVVSDDLEIFSIKNLIQKTKKSLEKLYDAETDEILELKSFNDLNRFIESKPNSQLSIFVKILEEANLLDKGKSGYSFINFGAIEYSKYSIPQGIYENSLKSIDISKISEDVTNSWYKESKKDMFESKSEIDMQKDGYSFAKAPRYNSKVYQTGPLGEFLAINNPLFLDLYKKFKDSLFVRELSRLIRPLRYIKAMEDEILKIIKDRKLPLYKKPKIKKSAKGVGLTHAARGALGHWIKIKKGVIENYQIISPTTWNGSPRDKNGNLGPWEKALIGTEIKDLDNPVEIGHVIRSFDPCLVCTVHYLSKDMRLKI